MLYCIVLRYIVLHCACMQYNILIHCTGVALLAPMLELSSPGVSERLGERINWIIPTYLMEPMTHKEKNGEPHSLSPHEYLTQRYGCEINRSSIT